MKKEIKKLWKGIKNSISNTFHSLHGSTGDRVQDLENNIKLIDTVIILLLFAGIGQLSYAFGGGALAVLKAIGIEGAVAALAKSASLSKEKKVESVLYFILAIVMLVSGYANYKYSVNEGDDLVDSLIFSATIPILIFALTFARVKLDGEWANLTANVTVTYEEEYKKLKSKRGKKSLADKMRMAELENQLGLTV